METNTLELKLKVCAGLDVHAKTVVACVLTGPLDSLRAKKEVRTFGTRTFELHLLGEWLTKKKVEKVLMESTGQYWCPIWNVLEEFDLPLALANPQRIKGIPGRKTDQKDSEWIARLGRLGLVASSYIPSREIQELRSLTRTRKSYINERTQHRNRIQNVLQHANIKLADFITDIFNGSGRNCLELMLNGEKATEERVIQVISTRCKHSPTDIAESMNGALSKNQRILLESHLRSLERIDEEIHVLNKAIEEITSKYAEIMEALQTIPGVKKRAAEILLAEVGPNVDQFASAKQLASWAGLCPGSYESGGARKSSHIISGNKYLKTILYQCGGSAGRSNNTVFSEFYNRISKRGSKKKAIIACAHKILRIVYKILSEQPNRVNKKSSPDVASI